MTPHDDERLSALYRAGKQEEPPSHVDQQIRDAARRHTPRRHRGWIPALATAAVLVLAVAVMIRVPDERMDESDRGAPEPAAEPIPAAPAIGSRARTPVPEGVTPEKLRSMEQPPAQRFEYYSVPAPSEETTFYYRSRDPASAGEGVVDEALESADSAGQQKGVATLRWEAEGDGCRPPDSMLAEDRETLLQRIEELERQGRFEEAECLRLWLEIAPPR
jgi:hypothetical protein